MTRKRKTGKIARLKLPYHKHAASTASS